MTRRGGGPAGRRLASAGLAAAVCASLVACSTEEADAPRGADTPATSAPTTDPTSEPIPLTYGVFGSDDEVAAYQDVVDVYNERATTVEVTLQSWQTSEAMMRDIAAGADVPDAYQVTRGYLGQVVQEERNVPLFGLLEDRDISYGDNYSLDTIEAFSLGDDLQCMPYGVSPTVMYINTDLVQFDRMRLRGLPAPEDVLQGWDLEEFAAAITFATRPRLQTRGFSLDPTLEGIAPYLYSGGGELVDDDLEPTALDLASSDNRETLETLLPLARDPLTTLSERQLRRASPLEWFERGRLGVLAGDRSITPGLREVPGLSFDVMPMPRVGRTATTGDVTGICIAPGPHVQRAADFLVHLISAEGFAPVADAGYVVPANTSVARSDEFLQPTMQPANAGVFNLGVDAMELLPLAVSDPELQASIQPLVRRLFTSTLPPDLEIVTEAIDEISRPILDPTYEPETPPASELPTEPSESSAPSEP